MEKTIETVLAEFKGLYEELGLHDKEMIVKSLCSLRDNITQANNILEIKEAYAKENLKDNYKCVYVEQSDTYKYIIIPINHSSIREIKDGIIYFNSPSLGAKSINAYYIGVTKQLAWCDAYNKLLAIQRDKL